VKYLLDVNLLLAAIWTGHSQHDLAFAWLGDKSLVVCPLVELGFLRISTQPKAFNKTMKQARQGLRLFLEERAVERLPDDLPALESQPASSGQVTGWYLADLAAKHGHRLATLDNRLQHPAAVMVG
jgi:predicted nucleic acid-binding protein